MKLGLQVPIFTWEGGPVEIGTRLGEIAATAEDVGFDSMWVMDHFFQLPMIGPSEMEMLEAYTTLGFLAASTKRVGLGTMVTGVTYRNPAILVKEVTTLDVLSGGRAWLGIGAAWFEREHDGLGVRFPPVKERFERLEEALQIAHQMWNPDDNGPFEGNHYSLRETINSPQALQTPHPRILIGGVGEKKTLRFVAKYADATNISAFGQSVDFVRRKLEVLKEHCTREGRNYDDIEKTILWVFMPGAKGERTGELVEQVAPFAEIGIQTVIGSVMGVDNLQTLEAIGKDVIPQVAKL
jgi:F420-dependent oxidoreductase-like protein